MWCCVLDDNSGPCRHFVPRGSHFSEYKWNERIPQEVIEDGGHLRNFETTYKEYWNVFIVWYIALFSAITSDSWLNGDIY